MSLNRKIHQTTRFIQEYKKRECLWNRKSKEYTNIVLKNTAYEELGKIFEASVPVVKKKINSLRSSFLKQEKLINASRTSGDDLYESKLFWFDDFTFIRDFTVPKQTKSNATESSHDISLENESLSEYNFTKDNISDSRNNSHPTPSIKVKKPRLTSESESPLDTVLEKLIRINEEKEDTFDIFGKFVASQLKNLPPQTSAEAIGQIQEILTQKIVDNIAQGNQMENLNKNPKKIIIHSNTKNSRTSTQQNNSNFRSSGDVFEIVWC